MPLKEDSSIEEDGVAINGVSLPDEEPTIEELDRIIDQTLQPYLDTIAARRKASQQPYAEQQLFQSFGVKD